MNELSHSPFMLGCARRRLSTGPSTWSHSPVVAPGVSPKLRRPLKEALLTPRLPIPAGYVGKLKEPTKRAKHLLNQIESELLAKVRVPRRSEQLIHQMHLNKGPQAPGN